MWQRLLCGTFIASFLTSCSTTEQIPPKPPISCSILSFESRAGMKPGEAESVSEMFSAALQKTGRFTVVERKQLNAVLQEQGFQATQSEENAAKARKILTIRKMFSGSVGMLGEQYVVNLKMIDVESSQVDFTISRMYDDDLEDIGRKFLPRIVQEILQTIDGPPTK